jgi:hypothetical protein
MNGRISRPPMNLYTYDPASNSWTNRGAAKLPHGNVGVWDGADRCFITHGGAFGGPGPGPEWRKPAGGRPGGTGHFPPANSLAPGELEPGAGALLEAVVEIKGYRV